MADTVAFVGLGNMGGPMARRLVEAGHHVLAFDVAAAAREAAGSAGAEIADSAAAAAQAAAVVILMLPDSDVVESVVGDLTLAPGTTVVDMSSSEPLRTRALAGRLAAQGVTLVDAPVSGGVKGAVGGRLTVMVGGEDPAVLPLLPLLGVFGTTFRAGPVGAGHAVKALNNLMSATHLLVTSEAMQAGLAFGLDPAVMLQIFNTSSGRSGSTENKWPNFVLPGTFDSGFGLRLMLKDMRIAATLAAELHRPSRLGADAIAVWAEAAADLPPTADHTEIARWLETAAPTEEPA